MCLRLQSFADTLAPVPAGGFAAPTRLTLVLGGVCLAVATLLTAHVDGAWAGVAALGDGRLAWMTAGVFAATLTSAPLWCLLAARRRHVEIVLRNGNARLEAHVDERTRELTDLFDEAPVGLTWIDPDGVILRANRAELDLVGYEHDEYVGRRIAEFHVDGQALEDLFSRVARGGTVRDRAAQLLRKDGAIRHVLMDANAFWQDDRLVHVRCFTRDVTDERCAQEILERARARAEEQADELEERSAQLELARNAALAASRAKSEFLANMSHEIRTPMTAILGYAELLSSGRLRRAERETYLDTIRRNGDYLMRLINDVLDLSKIEAGKMLLEAVAFSFPELVGEVEDLLRGRAEGKGLSFEVAVEADVPRYVRSDPTRIRQVLVNLLGNAIKFTETGTVRLRVEAIEGAASGRRRLRCTVIDTGIGMSVEQQARLFEPFGQVDASTTRTFGGTGLGLAISARLARALGGAIAVTSAEGAGSAFTLTVDVEQATEAAAVAFRRAERDAGAGRKLRLSGRILLAEDAPDSRRLLTFYLRKAGAQVDTAENGRVACQRVVEAETAGRPFDLVLMDMQMPEMDGYAATAALRAHGVRVPIVALTACAMDGDRERCLAAGCTAYVSKPVERETFLAVLHGHLAQRTAGRRERSMPTTRRPEDDRAPAADDVPVDDEMQELLAMFVQELPTRAHALETSLAERDLGRVAGIAHQLKGTARVYGFPRITDEAAALEASLRAGSCLDEIRVRVETVADLCREARAR